jgi:transposase
VEHQTEHRMEVLGLKRVSRIEVLAGPTGRRGWRDDGKARIVAESLAPGARVCDVAQRYGLIARHVSQWRGLARKRKLVLPVDSAPTFVPLVLEPATAPDPAIAKTDTEVIRVEITGAVLHVATNGSRERAAAMVQGALGFAPKAGAMVVFWVSHGSRAAISSNWLRWSMARICRDGGPKASVCGSDPRSAVIFMCNLC